MKAIYKYHLDDRLSTIIEEPIEKILDVQYQDGQLVAWAIIDDRQPKSKLLFKIFGTGWPIESDPGKYLKTLQDDYGYVWHVFVTTDIEKMQEEYSDFESGYRWF